MYVEEAEKGEAEEWRVAAVSCRELPENDRNNGVYRAAVSYHEMLQISRNGGKKELPGDNASCLEMAEMEEEKRLPIAATEWQR